MEGLEISEVLLSDVLFENENKRIDSEYFKKQFLNFFKNVPNLKPLGYFVKEGYRVVYENTKIIDKKEGQKRNYPFFLQATDLRTPFINTDNLYYVDSNEWKRYVKGRIKKGEILIEVKGKIDKVAIVPDDFPEKTLVTGSLFKLTVNEYISKHVLLTYLISKYGIAFKDRFKTNLLISYVSKPDLYRIPIPNFSKEFQEKIDAIFKVIFYSEKQSKTLYTQAENLLLESLGLDAKTFEVSENLKGLANTNIKSFKESFLTSGRLDAEYYQPKYEVLEEKIRNYEGGFCRLKDLTQSYSSGFPFQSSTYANEGYSLIRINNIKNGNLEIDNAVKIPLSDAQKSKKDIVKENDILISMSGTIGSSCKIPKNTKAVINQRILKITPQNYDFDVLPLLINSIIGKIQLERFGTGGVQTNLATNDILDILIPILPETTQTQISEWVEDSFRLKQESEALLVKAKQAVEMAIEQSEEKALQYIQPKTQ